LQCLRDIVALINASSSQTVIFDSVEEKRLAPLSFLEKVIRAKDQRFKVIIRKTDGDSVEDDIFGELLSLTLVDTVSRCQVLASLLKDP